MEKIKKHSLLFKIGAAVISLGVIAGAVVPISLYIINSNPDNFSSKEQKDKKSYTVVSKMINTAGQEEVVMKADNETMEIHGALKISKGGQDLIETVQDEEAMTSSEDVNGDYVFIKKEQKFIIYKKTIDKYEGEIHIEPNVIEKEFTCEAKRNIEFGNKEKIYLHFFKDGADITDDAEDPVTVALKGVGYSTATIDRDENGLYLQVTETEFAGSSLSIIAYRKNHKTISYDFEVGSFSKLKFNDKGDRTVYISKVDKAGKGLDEVTAIPNRWYDEKEDCWKTVKGIEDYGFANTEATRFSFRFQEDNSIEYVGYEAFADNSSLEGISLKGLNKVKVLPPKTDTHKGLFENCIKLKSNSISLPSEVKEIPDGAFYRCEALDNINFLDSTITKIGKQAFQECTALENVTLPLALTDIGDNAFEDCNFLKYLNMNDNLKNIGKKAFHNCPNIEVLIISGNVEYIGEDAFSVTKEGSSGSIYKVTIKDGDRQKFICGGKPDGSYPYSAMVFNNQPIVDLYLDSHVAYNSVSLNKNNGNLTGLFDKVSKIRVKHETTHVPSDDSYVGDNFEWRNNEQEEAYDIYRFKLDKFLTYKIEKQIDQDNYEVIVRFKKTDAKYYPNELILPSVYNFTLPDVSGDTRAVSTKDKKKNSKIIGIFDEGFTKTWAPASKDLVSVTIPNSIRNISASCFSGQQLLSKVIFEGGIDDIGAKAFLDCKSLKNITWGGSSTGLKISESAFQGCSELEYLGLTNSYPTISNVGYGAFYNCEKFKDSSIVEKATTLSNWNAFYNTAITYINLNHFKDGQISDYAFNGMNKLKTIDNIGFVVKNNTFAGVSNVSTVNFSSLIKRGDSLPVVIEEEAFKNFSDSVTTNLPSIWNYWTTTKSGGTVQYYTFTSSANPWIDIKEREFKYRNLSSYITYTIRRSDKSTTMSKGQRVYQDSSYVIKVENGIGGSYSTTAGVTISRVTDNFNLVKNPDNTVTISDISNLNDISFKIEANDNPNNYVIATHPVGQFATYNTKMITSSCCTTNNDDCRFHFYDGEWEAKHQARWYWCRKAFHTLQDTSNYFTVGRNSSYHIPEDNELKFVLNNRRWGLTSDNDFSFGYVHGYLNTSVKLTSSSTNVWVYLYHTVCGSEDLHCYNSLGEELFTFECNAG